MYSVLSQLIYKQLLSNDLPNAVVDGIAFHGVEAGRRIISIISCFHIFTSLPDSTE
jgi:hypothetical protein